MQFNPSKQVCQWEWPLFRLDFGHFLHTILSMVLQAVALPDIDRSALHAAVAARLRDMVIEGELEPGARLNERVLCEQLKVSRTPLREAFKMLAGEGLVELLPNRGAVVARMGIEDIEAAFAVIAALEGLAGELAAQHITEAELAEIRALQFDMLASHSRRDLPGYFRANMRIHALINSAAKNPVLTETFNASTRASTPRAIAPTFPTSAGTRRSWNTATWSNCSKRATARSCAPCWKNICSTNGVP